jgi:antitoxin CptB
MSHHDTTSNRMREDDLDVRRRRLLFRCWHRGTQEIDIILGSFATSSLNGFESAQLECFEALRDCADIDVFDWITGRSTPPPAHDHDVMRLLSSFRYEQKRG